MAGEDDGPRRLEDLLSVHHSLPASKRNQYGGSIPMPRSEYMEELEFNAPGWSDTLFTNCGFAYLGGLAAGGTVGFYQGCTSKLNVASSSAKLRMNAILNSMGRVGGRAGNSIGALVFLGHLGERIPYLVRGIEDNWNWVPSGGVVTGIVLGLAGKKSKFSVRRGLFGLVVGLVGSFAAVAYVEGGVPFFSGAMEEWTGRLGRGRGKDEYDPGKYSENEIATHSGRDYLEAKVLDAEDTKELKA